MNQARAHHRSRNGSYHHAFLGRGRRGPVRSYLGDGGGGAGPVVVVLRDRAGEGAAGLLEVLLLVVVVVLRGVEVDAGAALEGREEGRRHTGRHPHRIALHVHVRQEVAVGVDAVHEHISDAGNAKGAALMSEGACVGGGILGEARGWGMMEGEAEVAGRAWDGGGRRGGGHGAKAARPSGQGIVRRL
jgi:hypothetical protein